MKFHVARKAVVVLAMAAAVMGSHTPPAGAAVAAGAGVVSGTVTVSPGVDLSPNDNTFTFNDTLLTGAITIDGAPFVGDINVPTITGGSTGETSIMGSGTVNSFTATGVMDLGVITKRLEVTVSGTFLRVGSVTVVILNGSAELDCDGLVDQTFTANNVTVVVVALFVPTTGNGASGTNNDPLPPIPMGAPVTAATFAGVFAAAGT